MLTNVHHNAVKYIIANSKWNTLTQWKSDEAPSIKEWHSDLTSLLHFVRIQHNVVVGSIVTCVVEVFATSTQQ